MKSHRLLICVSGIMGTMGMIGCASWRQPVPQATDIRTSDIRTSGEPARLPVAATTFIPLTNSKTASSVSVENQAPVLIVPVQHTTVESVSSPQSKAEDPPYDPATDSLTLFGDALKNGDKAAAASHLETYVREHPDQPMFELQLAELLMESHRDAKAQIHFEKFVAGAQSGSEALRKYLSHAHTRLMEIGQRTDDPFAESFHRGVGLLILVQEQDKNPERDGGFCEEMLCRALQALNEARDRKPGDPRVRVYLAEVYLRMGNRRASENERTAARSGAIPGILTPAEQLLVMKFGS